MKSNNPCDGCIHQGNGPCACLGYQPKECEDCGKETKETRDVDGLIVCLDCAEKVNIELTHGSKDD